MSKHDNNKKQLLILESKAMRISIFVLLLLFAASTLVITKVTNKQGKQMEVIGSARAGAIAAMSDMNKNVVYNDTAFIEASFNQNDNTNDTTNDKEKDKNKNDKRKNDKNKNDIDYVDFDIKDVKDYNQYSKSVLNVRLEPDTDSEVLSKLNIQDEVTVTGKVKKTDWVEIEFDGDKAFVDSTYLADTKEEIRPIPKYNNWKGSKLTPGKGTITGPSGKETYYNMDMSGVINIMRRSGYNYQYWVREDGVKMYGEYIMVAANLNVRPRGSIVPTSLGQAIVCDTGEFAASNSQQLDLAVAW